MSRAAREWYRRRQLQDACTKHIPLWAAAVSALLRPRHFDGDTISPGRQNVKGGAQPMTHCSLALPLTLEEGLSFSSISDCNLLPWRGETRSAGPNFSAMRNWGKNRLGRSPLRTSLGYEAGTASSLRSARHPCCGPCYCHHTRPPWAAGPMAGWFLCPGLPWSSGVPAAGRLVLHPKSLPLMKNPCRRHTTIIRYSFIIFHFSFSYRGWARHTRRCACR